jgi:predicted helicase
VNIIRRAPKRYLADFYKEQLFANEILLLGYYIAALNIEHAYYEITKTYDSFEGLCFVDTLDIAEAKQVGFSFMNEANTLRVERQKRTPIHGHHRQSALQYGAEERKREQQEPFLQGH